MSEYIAAIGRHRRQLGNRLLLLAHYYQDDEIFRLADITGDSYGLAVAAARSSADFVVMCGVKFMAETNQLLIGGQRLAFIPDSAAGCPMAEMIDAETYRTAMDKLTEASGVRPRPLLYVNSTLATKAAVGADDGVCCTSSNAEQILRRLLAGGHRVFFLPDRNLAVNCARRLGLTDDQICLIGRHTDPGQVNRQARLYVWDGFCIVHHRIEQADVERARQDYPQARIIVHPECPETVVREADYAGSTKQLLDYFNALPAGSQLVVGTEANFVERLKRLRTDIEVHHLVPSTCANMAKITLPKLADCLAAVASGDREAWRPYEVTVSPSFLRPARAALERMIEMVEGG
ncbi:MAG: quinolinate synthase [Negativicutes bacterium]|nr:quinolinate synthase [Negativicutes bacterium]